MHFINMVKSEKQNHTRLLTGLYNQTLHGDQILTDVLQYMMAVYVLQRSLPFSHFHHHH